MLPWLHCLYQGIVCLLSSFNITFRDRHEHIDLHDVISCFYLPVRSSFQFIFPSRWNNILDNSEALFASTEPIRLLSWLNCLPRVRLPCVVLGIGMSN